MTNPLTPEGMEELALTYAQEYRLPVDRMKELIKACERFDQLPQDVGGGAGFVESACGDHHHRQGRAAGGCRRCPTAQALPVIGPHPISDAPP